MDKHERQLRQMINQVRDAATQLTERISHSPNRGNWLNKSHDRKAA